MEIFINIILVAFVLGVLILVHELGHFLAAKITHTRVEEFSMGFGPKIFSKKIGETEYMIKALPLGGYVKITGEGDEYYEEKDLIAQDVDPDKRHRDPRSLLNKPLSVRFFIMVAGVLMNILLAIILFYVVLADVDFTLNYPSDMFDYQPYFGTKSLIQQGDFEYLELTQDGNAKTAGLPNTGIIQSVDSVPIEFSKTFQEYIVSKKNENVSIEVCSKDLTQCSVYTVLVSNEGKIGIVFTSNFIVQIKYEGLNQIFAGFVHSANQISLIGYYIPQLFKKAAETGDYKEVAVNSLSSPIALYFVVDAFKGFGIMAMLDLIAGLSFSLAVVNLLPIPALDGGRVFLLFIEAVRGKPLNQKLEAVLIQVSFYILMVLMVLIVLKDVFFLDFIKNMF